jgi:hypothetical protein
LLTVRAPVDQHGDACQNDRGRGDGGPQPAHYFNVNQADDEEKLRESGEAGEKCAGERGA